MGWKAKVPQRIKYRAGKDPQIQKKEEADDIIKDTYPDYTLVDSCLSGNDYYAALTKYRDSLGAIIPFEYRETTAAIMKIKIKDGPKAFEFFLEMEDNFSPRMKLGVTCPKRILDLLSPPRNFCALQWRMSCRYQTIKKEYPLKELPCGTLIKEYTSNKQLILEKKSPDYQFKKPWWYISAEGKYSPEKYISAYYEVLESKEE